MGAFSMEVLNVILAAVISLSGLPMGLLLAKITKEELKPGKKYFQWMQALILIIAVLAVFYSYDIGTVTFIGLAVIVSAIIIKSNPRAIISYFVFFILFVLGFTNANLLIVLFSLVFLYGLSTGALIRLRGLKRYMKEEIENPTQKRQIIAKKIIYIVWVILLEIISFPAFFMKNKARAKYHLKFVCPICPSSRKQYRDVRGKSTCWWEYNWRKGNYGVPRHFGMINWIRQYLRLGTNLKQFKDYDKNTKK